MADFLTFIGYILILVLIVYIITKVFKKKNKCEIPARDINKGHHWSYSGLFSSPAYCNISGTHILEGAFCDSCGICVDDIYVREANKTIPCKNYARKSNDFKHHWVHGTIPLCSYCCVCNEHCGGQPQLCDYRCCWCQRTAHEDCKDLVKDICDFGIHKEFIVPPNCVTLKLVGWKGRKHLIVGSVKQPPVPNWSPLIVIANRNSGNNDGGPILQFFRGLLNPAQVIDLADLPPDAGLEWCHLLPEVRCRVVAAGGDGTIGWILTAIENMKLHPKPHVAILPLGTGNDLSRVLGWGEGYTGTSSNDLQLYLEKLSKAAPVKLDRWEVKIVNRKKLGIGFPRYKKTVIMNNYASIGVDALVTLNFHKKRVSQPSLTGSRLINKLWYFSYGTRDLLERECRDLHKKVRLELDGVEMNLPELEGIVVLNIGSWGGGCRPWNLGGEQKMKQNYDDALLEVFGLYSSFHVAQLQVGLAEPYRFGQAKVVKISLIKGKAPVQVDGEPWNQGPAEITLTHYCQANMLAYYD